MNKNIEKIDRHLKGVALPEHISEQHRRQSAEGKTEPEQIDMRGEQTHHYGGAGTGGHHHKEQRPEGEPPDALFGIGRQVTLGGKPEPGQRNHHARRRGHRQEHDILPSIPALSRCRSGLDLARKG